MKAPFDFVIEPKGNRYNNTTKVGKSIGFVEGDITVGGETIITFGGVGKILKA